MKRLCLLVHFVLAAKLWAASPPNVVIIYGDDVGFGDVGAYGSKMIPTPNIDRLAAEGLRFTDGHCTASTCTPSRYSMLTGILAFRNGVNVLPPNAPLCIPTDILTLPKLFNKAGYETAVIGKWHLGLGQKGKEVDWNGEVKPGPAEIGFKKSLLLPSTNDRVPCVYLAGNRVLNLDPGDPLYVGKTLQSVNKPGSTQYPDGKKDRAAMTYYQSSRGGHNESVVNGIGRMGYMSGGKAALWDDETMTDVFVEETRKYIAENKDRPFFLYFASQCIHVPRAPNKRFQGKTELGYRGDAMVEFDWATGEIMKALEENGLAENTIVIFSSDNGPTYDDGYQDGTTIHASKGESDRGHDGSGIWRGGKYQIYEGGTRVPFIVRWPARIKPGVSSALVNQIDFIASFAHLLKLELGKDEAPDSRDQLDALLGTRPNGLPDMVEEDRSVLALRQGDFKFVEASTGNKMGVQGGNENALYNLSDDPGETRNVMNVHPERAAEMAALLKEIRNGRKLR